MALLISRSEHPMIHGVITRSTISASIFLHVEFHSRSVCACFRIFYSSQARSDRDGSAILHLLLIASSVGDSDFRVVLELATCTIQILSSFAFHRHGNGYHTHYHMKHLSLFPKK